MKIIEAMKKVKANRQKITDLQSKISENSAHLSYETPMYADITNRLREWAQSCEDLGQDNISLLTRISKTNLQTSVPITMGGRVITKTIAEWIWRRREYAALSRLTFASMTDRNLREGVTKSSTGVDMTIKLIRNYDPERRDACMATYQEEPSAIDAALEVINAITDLKE